MPVIVFHGIHDTIVHPINGQQVIIQWAQTNFLVEGGTGSADVTPIEVKSELINGKSYTQHIYDDGHGEPLMELWMIDQMGHTWSGGNPNGSYTTPQVQMRQKSFGDFSLNINNSWKKRIETSAKYSISAPVVLLVNPQDEKPNKNFFSILLSKLIRRKNNTKS